MSEADKNFDWMCRQCCGQGELVTDFERYMRGEDAITECPSCNGTGRED